MKKLYRIFFFLSFSLSFAYGLSAQQLAQYSLYFLDPVQFNPAYAGLDNSLSVTGAYRSQWSGLPGNPVGQRLSAHLPLYIISSGIGIEAEIDELGARRYTRFGLSYNYQLVTGRQVWSLGFSARMNQFQLDGSQLRTPDGSYTEPNVIVHNDDLLAISQVNDQQLSFGAGLYYQSDRLEGGLSLQHLNAPTLAFDALDWTLERQYNLYLRANLDIIGDWVLYPSLLVRSDGTQTQAEISAVFQRDDNIFLGTSFRGYNDTSTDAVIILAGLNVSPQIKLAYAYDITLSGLRTVQNGSHEIVVKYNLGKPIGAGSPPPIIFNPRTKE